MAQTIAGELTVKEIASIAFASVLFGGSVWASLPNMFNSLDPSKLEDVLSLWGPLISARFNKHLSKWLRISWKCIEDQTLSLLEFLKD